MTQMCLYLWYMCLSWKTLDKNTLRKTKTHHPILQTDTTNVSFRKGSTPQNKNRSYPSGMTCLKPQDAKDYIRFHQTLEYIQPPSPSTLPEFSRRKTARYQVVPCDKGGLLKTDARMDRWTVDDMCQWWVDSIESLPKNEGLVPQSGGRVHIFHVFVGLEKQMY